MNCEDGQVYSVCILQFSYFTKYNRMQSKHKQNVNIADETLTDYSFLSRYHYTKSKNYLKRRYRIYKDDIEFVTKFPCLLVFKWYLFYKYKVVISVCLSACLFVCPIITQEPLNRFASNFDWGNRECS